MEPHKEPPWWTTKSISRNPGGGAFQSAKVRTGILRPGDCCLLRRSRRLAGVLMGWSSRSRVAALADSSRWRTPGSRSRWPWRSMDSTRWGNAAFSRLPQIRSAASQTTNQRLSNRLVVAASALFYRRLLLSVVAELPQQPDAMLAMVAGHRRMLVPR